MSNKILLTRNQIARIVNNNPEAVKAFENLFKLSTETTPSNIAQLYSMIDDAILESGNGTSKSNSIEESIRREKKQIVNITSDYMAKPENSIVFCDCTSGPISVTLPDPKILGVSVTVAKIDTSANQVTISSLSGELVAGLSSQTLLYDRECLDFVSDGTNWQIGG